MRTSFVTKIRPHALNMEAIHYINEHGVPIAENEAVK